MYLTHGYKMNETELLILNLPIEHDIYNKVVNMLAGVYHLRKDAYESNVLGNNEIKNKILNK